MPQEFSPPDIMNLVITDFMRNIHTCKPAVVTAVSGTRVDCQILTKTRFSNDEEIEQSEIFGVPFLVISGKKGTAKITFPVSVGDNVLVLFSDRNFGELLESDGQSAVSGFSKGTHNYDPILALPCFFTSPNEIENDTENVVIANGSTTVVIAPDGNVTITAPTVAIEGDMTVSGNLEVGGDIDADGEVTAGNTPLTTHTHNYTDDGSPVTTQGPNPPGIPV